jgi:cbb3-type cytochrome oxidase subunit 3
MWIPTNKLARTIGVVVVLLLLLTGNVVLFNKWRKTERERKQAVQFSLADELAAKWYKGKYEREVIKVNVLDLSNRNARELRETDRLKFVEQFEGVKRSLRNVESVQSASITARLVGSAALRDTINGQAFTLPVPGGFGLLEGVIMLDTIRIKGTILVPIQGAIYWRRGKILGILWRGWPAKKIYEAHLTSPNPNIRITDFEFIRIGKK